MIIIPFMELRSSGAPERYCLSFEGELSVWTCSGEAAAPAIRLKVQIDLIAEMNCFTFPAMTGNYQLYQLIFNTFNQEQNNFQHQIQSPLNVYLNHLQLLQYQQSILSQIRQTPPAMMNIQGTTLPPSLSSMFSINSNNSNAKKFDFHRLAESATVDKTVTKRKTRPKKQHICR